MPVEARAGPAPGCLSLVGHGLGWDASCRSRAAGLGPAGSGSVCRPPPRALKRAKRFAERFRSLWARASSEAYRDRSASSTWRKSVAPWAYSRVARSTPLRLAATLSGGTLEDPDSRRSRESQSDYECVRLLGPGSHETSLEGASGRNRIEHVRREASRVFSRLVLRDGQAFRVSASRRACAGA